MFWKSLLFFLRCPRKYSLRTTSDFFFLFLLIHETFILDSDRKVFFFFLVWVVVVVVIKRAAFWASLCLSVLSCPWLSVQRDLSESSFSGSSGSFCIFVIPQVFCHDAHHHPFPKKKKKILPFAFCTWFSLSRPMSRWHQSTLLMARQEREPSVQSHLHIQIEEETD